MADGCVPRAALALAAAAGRAIADDPRLTLRDDGPYLAGVRLGHQAVGLRSEPGADVLTLRGVGDGVGLRLSRSDAGMHAALRPERPLERLVFDLLEQYRVEAAVPTGWPGVRRNLRNRHRQWLRRLHATGAVDSPRTMLILCTAEISRAAIVGEPMDDDAADLIEAVRFVVGPRVAPELAAARRVVHDQQEFGRHALAVARAVGDLGARVGDDRGANDTSNDQAAEDAEDAERARAMALLLEPDGDGELTGTDAGSGRIRANLPFGYRIFTAAHDQSCAITDLVRAARLDEHRRTLARSRDECAVNVRVLASRLRTALQTGTHDSWTGGLADGLIDGARLTRLITSASDGHIFRDRVPRERADAAVSILVDCSGSMKALAPATAVLVDLLTHALDLAGADTEVLGFTTVGWNGSQARVDWERAGRPDNPGRLTDVRHIVVKGFDTPWRRGRRALGGLLERRLYCEGVDGEAVAWAAERLLPRRNARKILLVISDGGPAEAATARVNRPDFLDIHLAQVAAAVSRDVHLIGLQAGGDLSAYYPHTAPVELTASSARADVHRIADALATYRTVRP